MKNPMCGEHELKYPDVRFEVFVESGDVYCRYLNADGSENNEQDWKFSGQLEWDSEAISYAVMNFLSGINIDDDLK